MPEDKVRIHSDIFHLVCNSNGGFTHDEVYTMPVFLRYFNLKMLIEQKDKESKQANNSSGEHGNPTVSRPSVINKK